MSLGNNPDDASFARKQILSSAADLVILQGLSHSEAIDHAKQLEEERAQAEAKGDVDRDENGHVIDYLEERLSYPQMTPEQRQSVREVYESLCENEGLDAG